MSTGLQMECPKGTHGRTAPRLGLAVKHGMDTLAGVIDGDCRGKTKILLMNHGEHKFTVTTGDGMAQLIFEHNSNEAMEEVDLLTTTE